MSKRARRRLRAAPPENGGMLTAMLAMLYLMVLYVLRHPATLDYWDGFDEYANMTDAGMFGWTGTIASTTSGRISGTAFRINNNNIILGGRLVSNARQTIGFAWRYSNNTIAGTVLTVREGATTHCNLVYNGNGTFTINRAGAAITFSSGSATSSNAGIASNTWYYLELDVTINDTTGAWEFRVNEVTYGSGSGGDTRNGGSGVIDTLQLLGPNAVNSDFDDFYVASGSTSFQGDCRVMSQPPNASGTYTGWTPNASTNVSRINQTTQDGDTTYNSTSTAATRDSFTFPSLGITGTILGLISMIVSRKDDAGTRNIQISVRSGTTDYDSGSFAQSTSYAGYVKTDLTDPDTGTDWTVSGVNNAEIGYENV